MLELLWLIPALPFAGALILALVGRALSRRLVSLVGVGSIAVSPLFQSPSCLRSLAAEVRMARSCGPG